MFATDSEADLRNIAKAAPGSRIYARILTEGTLTADWPLSRKFGCESDMAMDLLILARDLGLEPYGVSFHVGSQQREIGAWDAALGKVKVIFNRLWEEDGIELKMINMGGGFPANYLQRTNELAIYAEEIARFLHEDFMDEMPEIIIEPGRSLISNAGVLVSEVVLISRKSRTALHRWVYTDVGKFSGLIETLDESIKYPIFTEKNGELENAIIAGPTCDSADIMYENYKYGLPFNLATGDRLYWLSTGAYTTIVFVGGVQRLSAVEGLLHLSIRRVACSLPDLGSAVTRSLAWALPRRSSVTSTASTSRSRSFRWRRSSAGTRRRRARCCRRSSSAIC